MPSQQQRWRPCAIGVFLIGAIVCGTPAKVAAQEREQSSFLGSVVKGVVLDPTTYAPAAIGYDATMRDWKTSQPLFQRGFMEHNPRFTVSGLPNDLPVDYEHGNHKILMDAFATLQISLVNNIADRVIERSLIERYPNHRKLVRTLNWIERAAFASSMAYILSEAHYRQSHANEQLARQMGY